MIERLKWWWKLRKARKYRREFENGVGFVLVQVFYRNVPLETVEMWHDPDMGEVQPFDDGYVAGLKVARKLLEAERIAHDQEANQ